MKLRYTYFFLIIVTLNLAACNQNKTITNRNDYKQFLLHSKNNVESIDQELAFWSKKLKEEPQHFAAQTKMASLYSKRFQYSGNIAEVHLADSFYQAANQLQKRFSSGIYRNLAANAITKHQFWQSKYYLDSAVQMGDNLSNTILQQFDTELELGNLYNAKQLLKRYPYPNSFEILIRKAKMSDANGKLNEAIELMEQALLKVTVTNDKTAWLWVKSNLGDFYSHANRFKEAYESYIDVLKIDSENYHCLKGIAWIAFSFEKNTEAAKEILLFLKMQHAVPDYDLILAEIATFEGNQKLNTEYTASFLRKVKAPAYGEMYNTYLFDIYADDSIDTAMSIAKKEINNRPTPQSYDLLSWAFYKQGNINEALRIASHYVENKCFEPKAQYHLALIYSANGYNKKARTFLKEVKSSFTELGPVFEDNFYKQKL